MNTKQDYTKIAIVVPSYEEGGGVPAIVDKFYSLLSADTENRVDIISIAVSRSDKCSVKLLNPLTWFRGIRIENRKSSISNHEYLHVGSWLAELEMFRYLPRGKLSKLLINYDIIQLVTGAPSWQNVVPSNLAHKSILQTATLNKYERTARLKQYKWLRALYEILNQKLLNYLDIRGLRRSEYIIVENMIMYKYAKAINNNVKFLVPAVDTEIFSPGSDDINRNGLLFVGRLNDPRKDVRLLIEALGYLKRDYGYKGELILAGLNPPSNADIKLIKNLKLEEDVVIKTGLDVTELVELYRQAQLFVIPSVEEGLGIVAMEAMACGTPIISTDNGGIRTLIESNYNGIILAGREPEEMARTINNMLLAPDIMKVYARRSVDRIKQEFSYKAMHDTLMSIYNDM